MSVPKRGFPISDINGISCLENGLPNSLHGGVWGPVLKIGASPTSVTRSYQTFMTYPQNMPYISEMGGKTPYKLKSVLIFDAFLIEVATQLL